MGGCPASQPVARPSAPPTKTSTAKPVVQHGRPEVTIEPNPPKGGEMSLELETPPVEATAGVALFALLRVEQFARFLAAHLSGNTRSVVALRAVLGRGFAGGSLGLALAGFRLAVTGLRIAGVGRRRLRR